MPNDALYAGIPHGAILLWSGSIASIPKGFVLCNGANGTPDLRNKFVMCAKEDVAGVPWQTTFGYEGFTGGSPEVPVIVSGRVDSTDSCTTIYSDGIIEVSMPDCDHRHILDGAVGITLGLPPYYALAYIMKL
jgi:hypothetical protein